MNRCKGQGRGMGRGQEPLNRGSGTWGQGQEGNRLGRSGAGARLPEVYGSVGKDREQGSGHKGQGTGL